MPIYCRQTWNNLQLKQQQTNHDYCANFPLVYFLSMKKSFLTIYFCFLFMAIDFHWIWISLTSLLLSRWIIFMIFYVFFTYKNTKLRTATALKRDERKTFAISEIQQTFNTTLFRLSVLILVRLKCFLKLNANLQIKALL
jgi:hypothetical protein